MQQQQAQAQEQARGNEAAKATAHVSPLLPAKLIELRDKHGITLTLEDAIWLNARCLALTSPAARASERAIECTVGNVTFRQLSIGAAEWYSSHADAWANDRKMQVYVLGYAMAHADESRAFPHDEIEIEQTVLEWVLGVTCTIQQMIDAIGRILESADTRTQQDACGGDGNWATVVAWLCKHYGATPQYWRWKETMPDALQFADLALDMEHGRDGTKRTPPRAKAAQMELDWCMHALVEKHKGVPRNG